MLERVIAKGVVSLIGRRMWVFEWYQINDLEWPWTW